MTYYTRPETEQEADQSGYIVGLETRIEAQAALIAELDAALALVTDDETPFHMAYNAAKTARAKVQAAEAWPMPKAVQNG
jgi:hypothetical protein